jgi:hypothetical protein
MRTLFLTTAAFAALMIGAPVGAHAADDCAAHMARVQSAYRMFQDEVARVDAMDAKSPLSDSSTRDQKRAFLDQGQNTSTMGHWMLDEVNSAAAAHCLTAPIDMERFNRDIRLIDLSLKRGQEKFEAEFH